ncbi:hypothetical protein [Simplicispira lacusdiani]|uniref:hypothetical protein n=1 Tax=Simplicispira lacusdiani TaxID=2213010 RepID=UPI000E71382D|nr:hypothetical protein [Simplicispira lacusdiani]
MRRLFAILLVCLFSLQSGWAVAASYCGHEKAPEATHFGHHAHDHGAAGQPDADPDGAGGALTVDLDCHACHACTAGIVPGVPADAPKVVAGFTPQPHDRLLPFPTLKAPERPDWRGLA